MAFFLCLECQNQQHLQLQKEPLLLRPSSISAELWQKHAHPIQVLAKAGDISACHSAWADEGVGWAALGVQVCGRGIVLSLMLPS